MSYQIGNKSKKALKESREAELAIGIIAPHIGTSRYKKKVRDP